MPPHAGNPAEDDDEGWVEVPSRKGHGGIGMLAFLVLFVLVSIRAAAEWRMMDEHGPDAQMGIWILFAWFKFGAWLVTGGIIAALLDYGWHDASRRRTILVIGAVWIMVIGFSAYRYYEGARALADAANASTPAERLHKLVHFWGIQAGYELDNRIAANPNTSAEDLRSLYERGNLGTLSLLARNPNTPTDIREQWGIVHPDANGQDPVSD